MCIFSILQNVVRSTLSAGGVDAGEGAGDPYDKRGYFLRQSNNTISLSILLLSHL